MPLTFSYDSGLVVHRGIFSVLPRIQRLGDWLHERDMILTANFNAGEGGIAGFFGADRIDVFGIEQGLPERAIPSEGTTTDRFAMLKRTIAYQRPVSTFDYRLGYATTTLAQVRRRIEQNLFYGFYPGGPANGTFLSDERRRLVRRYVPLFRELSAAGWEPVTYARSSDTAVWVERFGRVGRNDLSFTVRNETAEARSVRLTIQLRAAGGGDVTTVSAQERVTRTVLATTLEQAAGRARVEVTVPANTTRMISLDLTF
jgi:hypothetical protein